MKRLYPALVTLVLVTTAYITLFARDLLTNIRAIIATNFYMFIIGSKWRIMNLILISLVPSHRLPIYGHYRSKDNFIFLADNYFIIAKICQKETTDL